MLTRETFKEISDVHAKLDILYDKLCEVHTFMQFRARLYLFCAGVTGFAGGAIAHFTEKWIK